MKKNVMKTMVAAVCVVAAGMGGFKAYSFANQSEADMLLAENVEALSQCERPEGSLTTASSFYDCCYSYGADQCHYYYYNSTECLQEGTISGYKNK